MIWTDRMMEHFRSSDTLTSKHMFEFLDAVDDDGTILKERLHEDGMELVIFDTGFVLFKIEGTNAIFWEYYRSKDSTVSIKDAWDDLRDTLRENGCERIICHTKVDKVKNVYERKYGFIEKEWDDDLGVYILEQSL